MAIVITRRLLWCARKAYDVSAAAPVPAGPDDVGIGWVAGAGIDPPNGFVGGPAAVNAGYVGETATEIIVAFRGTLPFDSPDRGEMIRDWLDDLDAILIAAPGFTGLVHQGFYNALSSIWAALGPEIAARSAHSPAKPIHVTGHSKGGAMANLGACLIRTLLPGVPVFVTTFAAAKPGDAAFQANYDVIIPHSVRFECQDDIVPHVPPSETFFTMFSTVPAIADVLGGLTHGYQSVGDLYFIDWSDTIVANSTLLHFQRFAHMAELMVTLGFPTIVADHSIGTGSVYDNAPYV